MRKLVAVLLILMLSMCSAVGELSAETDEADVTEEITVTDTPEAAVVRPTAIPNPSVISTPDGSFPELNASGFMDDGEFVYANADTGIWRYCSPTLRVEIKRCHTTSPLMTWYEAEVFSRNG